ncbi:hypothetical protein IQ259_03510 [Fortiea sp. LEGE XX443]|uniref:hypothetical protein n=1 Tax=Fortiea sp. LEGE XX443 TaxID=1828611 RepID=UPI0018803CA3|nr:hypothetical protein [Fortiea sp. LEGE XX443]MBE9004118.1 hypothetical protein [Fortiea sp. LEGE XX443]
MNSNIAKFLFPTVAGTFIGFSTILGSFGTAFALQSTVITSPVKQAISNVVLYLQDSSGNFIKVKVDNFSALPETKTYDPTSVLQKYSGYTLVAYTVKAGNNKSSGMGSGEGELFIISSGIQQNQLPTYNTTDANTYQYKSVYSTTTAASSTTATNTTSANTTATTTSSVDSSVNTVSSETSGSTQPAPVNESTVVSAETGSETPSAPLNESAVVSLETSGSTQPEAVNESTVISSETSSDTQSTLVAKSTIVSSNNIKTTQPVSVPEPGTITAIALFGLGSLFTKKKLTSSSK